MMNLFHQAVGLELVTVGQTSDKRSLTMPVEPHLRSLALGPAQGCAFGPCTVDIVLRLIIRIGRIGSHASMPRTTLVCFAIEQEVA
jgi:hypothetical protein